jgi:hypothetical protein
MVEISVWCGRGVRDEERSAGDAGDTEVLDDLFGEEAEDFPERDAGTAEEAAAAAATADGDALEIDNPAMENCASMTSRNRNQKSTPQSSTLKSQESCPLSELPCS